MKIKIRILFQILFISFIIFQSLIFCKREKIGFSEPTFIYDGYPLNVPQEKDVLYFSVLPYKNSLELAYDFDPLVKHLSEKTQRRIIFKPLDQYYKIHLLLEKNKLHLAMIDPYVYVSRNVSNDYIFSVKPVFKNVQKNKSLLVARNDNPVKSIFEIKANQEKIVLSFDNPDSTFGYIIPLRILKNLDIDPEKFKDIAFSSNFENTIQGILSGNFDLGWVDVLAFEKFKITAIGLKVLYESEEFEHYPIIIQKDLPPELQQKLIDAFLNLNENQHKEILQSIHPQLIGFRKTSESEFKNL
ncbi:MAG: phosphate/phosphite/phosphonate ABC transporter substrate-binding protein [Leptospiraceae bacterium]|nr:phosphate/phosphite/phosphonate ABC transporter substrate-binding protein [Leptospiraceae bacterium]MDW7976257.1 phosphate/phosphite/phosphonate ABC transporter substrate-binding protein [Leptospiraceae bacterium]